MKHKILTFALALLTVGSAWAQEIFTIGDLTYAITDYNLLTVEVYDCSSSATIVNIPESVTYYENVYSVTSIRYQAFGWSEALTQVTIPNSVTEIGIDAFKKCPSLQQITLPNSITSIGHSAFKDCSSLAQITIPENITTIESETFAGCSSLTEITISDNITTIENNAFSGCISLSSIVIPDNVTEIGAYAFNNCSSLTHITIGEGVTNMDKYAFNDCNAISDITWNAVHCQDFEYYSGPFTHAANNIINFNFGNQVEYIPSGLCYGLSSIRQFTLPSSVTDIGRYAFSGCSSLTQINIPDNITTIEEETFASCESLSTITLPNNITSIGDNAFGGCQALTTITIPSNVTSIGQYAFFQCINLAEINVQATTPPSISNNSFFGIKSSVVITIPENCQDAYMADPNWKILFDMVSGEVNGTCGDNLTWSVNFNDSTLTISGTGNMDFYGNPNYVPWSNFSPYINTIDIHEGVTSITYGAFFNCFLVDEITIPSTITHIGGEAFRACYSLKEVKWNAINCETNGDIFRDDEITSFVFGESVKHIPAYLCYGLATLTHIQIPDNVESIGYGAFYGTAVYNDENNWTNEILYIDNCLIVANSSSLKGYVNIPNSTKLIAEYAFGDCNAITGITLPNSMQQIGARAFYNCTQLSQITLSNNINSIADETFVQCSSLTEITLPSNITSLGERVFVGCNSLSTINVLSNIPPTITSGTFENINPSATITIPEGSREAYMADPNWKRLLDMASGEISGTFGDNQNLTWTLTFADSTLTISGTGEMGYIYYNWPWEGFENYIAKVIMEEGVTSIANGAFYSHSNLREVTIPISVTRIENDAFYETALYNNRSGWTEGGLYIDNCLIATSEWQMGETGHFTIADGTRLIADEAFRYRSWLTGVTLPNSVTNIGERAFYNCNQLTQITLPSAVTYIGSEAFARCSLNTITVLATTPPTISSSTFSGLTPSATITIPEGSREAYLADPNWKRLFDMASGEISGTFVENQNLTWTLTFADSTLTISGTGVMGYIDSENSWEAFSSSIAKVIIEEGVTSIAHGAFNNHENVREVTIPSSVTSIGAYAFNGTALYYNENNWTNGGLYIDNCLIVTGDWQMDENNHFTVADGTRLIANEAFSYNSSLTGVTLPNSVTHIGDYILRGCENLASITVLATTPPVITSYTFEGVNTGIQLTIPEGSTALYEADPLWSSFLQFCSGIISGTCGANLTWTLTLADNTLTISGTGEMDNYLWGANPLPWEQYRSYINTVNIAEGVTSISGGAFSNSNLNSVNIPNSINKIGAYALESTQLYYDDSNWSNGALYIDNCLIATNSDAIGDYAIAEGTRIIADAAFNSYYEYDLLTGISLPNSVTHIGKKAFYNRNITKVTIGSGTQSIGEDAFSWCENLSVINIAATTPPVIAANTFQYISTDLQITVPAGSESLYLADPNWKRLFDIASGVVEGVCGENLTWVLNLADSTLTISGYGDMYDYDVWNDETYFPMPWEEFLYDNIKNIVLPDGITSIGDFAFLNDSYNMTSIHLPEGIRRIGKYAFAGNAGLTSISIPASVELIDTAAFYYCTELTAVQVNSNNRHYCSENGVLFNKDKSTLIIYPAMKQDSYYALPSNVKQIEIGAFLECQSLTEIVLPEGITTISSEAFSYCTNLVEINIPNSVNYIGEYAFDGTAIYEDESNWTEGVLYWDNCLIATNYEIPASYTIPSGTRLIAGGTFNTSELREITIPASVISIGEESFKWCNNLQEMTVYAQIPPILGANVFEEVSRNIPLYVPAGSLESYRNAAVWNEFQLQAIPATDLQTTTADGFESLVISNGTLYNPVGLPISIFDMQGRLIYNGAESIVNMATGIYIVRIEHSARKVFIP